MANASRKSLLHRSIHPGRLAFVVLALLVLGWMAGPQPMAQIDKRLIVGTKVTPPFAMKKEDGTWHGISIDLWREIMDELGIDFEWRELDLQGLLNGVTTGSIDAAVAALTITAPREKEMDFTHPFYRTGLSIAVQAPGDKRFLLAATILALSFFAIGGAMWFCDWIRHRRSNRTSREIRTGLLLVALVVIVSSLVAHIITFINLNATRIDGPNDLRKVSVATVPSSTSQSYLRTHGIRYEEYPRLYAALQALAAGKVDAILYDTALLRYLAKTDFKDAIVVLPLSLEVQEYGIAFPSGSQFRENINQHLIAIIQSPAWRTRVERYLAEILKGSSRKERMALACRTDILRGCSVSHSKGGHL